VKCIFVLDIFNGAVVHAVRGERSRYEPIERYSRIVTTSEPLGVLGEVRPKEVYIADLNLLTGFGENLDVISSISRKAKAMVDIGISNSSDLDRLPNDITPILGTETAPLQMIEEAASQRKVVASLDMKNRKVLTRDPFLAKQEPLQVLRKLNCLPLEAIILLELDRVGTSLGLDEEFLKKASLISEHPLILGGGVGSVEDLEMLESIGFSGALVATAVHNGRIPVELVR
jgi:phosphoribosylformimino-5-aminoimidazole carboxamide ribotide isomerase